MQVVSFNLRAGSAGKSATSYDSALGYFRVCAIRSYVITDLIYTGWSRDVDTRAPEFGPSNFIFDFSRPRRMRISVRKS